MENRNGMSTIATEKPTVPYTIVYGNTMDIQYSISGLFFDRWETVERSLNICILIKIHICVSLCFSTWRL